MFFKNKIYLAIFFASAFWFFLALAQVSITIYPTSFRLNLSPGESWDGEVTVVNPNNFPLLVRPEKEDFGTGAEGAIKLLGTENAEYGLSSWIKIDQRDVMLAPKDRKTYNFSIKVPRLAQPGGHYAAVLFRGLETEQQARQGSGIGISGRVGAIILVEIGGDVIKAGELAELKAPEFISHGPLSVSFKIKNTGNTHFSPEGQVAFSNLWQKEIVPIESKTVFGGYDRSFSATWDKKYFFGPVNVKISAKIPDGLDLKTTSIVVWAFPWQEAVIVLFVFGFLAFLFKYFKKKFKIVRVK